MKYLSDSLCYLPNAKRGHSLGSAHVPLTLALFVLRVRANDHYPTTTADNTALFTHFSYRCADFHVLILLFTTQVYHANKD